MSNLTIHSLLHRFLSKVDILRKIVFMQIKQFRRFLLKKQSSLKIIIMSIAVCGIVSLIGVVVSSAWSFFFQDDSSSILSTPTSIAVTLVTPLTNVVFAAPPTDTPTQTPTATLSPTSSSTPTITPTPTPSTTPTPLPPPPNRAYLEPMRHEYQSLNNCGPVAVAAAASFFGKTINQLDVELVIKGRPGDKNVSPSELVDYFPSIGLESVYRLNGNILIIKHLVANDIPVIVHQWLERNDELVGHYRVVRGYDSEQGILYTNDSYDGPRLVIGEEDFDAWWRPFQRGYIPVYRQEQTRQVRQILGNNWQVTANYQHFLAQSFAETQTIGDGYAFYNLGEGYFFLHDDELALKAYERSLTFPMHDLFWWYHFNHLYVLNEADEHQQILDITTPILEVTGSIEEIHLQRGYAYLGLSDVDMANLEFQHAVESNPSFTDAIIALETLP